MNWEFRAVHSTDSKALISEYRELAIAGLERWLATHVEPTEKQEEAGHSEFPTGFFRDESKDPFAYRFRFRVGYYSKDGFINMDPPEYDVAVQQTFYPNRSKTGFPEGFIRKRYIDNVPPIC
jgi:hypothetical protein